MPVIINEIEVLEPPPSQAPDRTPPPPAAPTVSADGLLRLLRDADGRQRRLVAD